MVSRPLDVVGPLDCRDLQALDHQTGEKVATAGQHCWDRGREDREDEEMPLLEQLHQLHQDTRAGWDHLDSQSYPLDRLDGPLFEWRRARLWVGNVASMHWDSVRSSEPPRPITDSGERSEQVTENR